uniref:YccE n=1 Tax=Bacillus subtilis TaxID=1423 RepID=O24720_BACIU|nr:YccE [Bacillus subtilis]
MHPRYQVTDNGLREGYFFICFVPHDLQPDDFFAQCALPICQRHQQRVHNQHQYGDNNDTGGPIAKRKSGCQNHCCGNDYIK